MDKKKNIFVIFAITIFISFVSGDLPVNAQKDSVGSAVGPNAHIINSPNSTTSTTTSAPTPAPTRPTNSTTTTTPPPTTSTPKPTTTPSPNSTTTSTTSPATSTVTPPNPYTTTVPSPTTVPPPKPDRSFDLPSFVGGIILALGVLAIGYVVYKFYRARTDPNYRTL